MSIPYGADILYSKTCYPIVVNNWQHYLHECSKSRTSLSGTCLKPIQPFVLALDMLLCLYFICAFLVARKPSKSIDLLFNSRGSSHVYMRLLSVQAVAQIMDSPLFGTRPLFWLILDYCRFHTWEKCSWNLISDTFYDQTNLWTLAAMHRLFVHAPKIIIVTFKHN